MELRITNRLLDRRARRAFAAGVSALGVLATAVSCTTTSTMSVTTDEAYDASVDAEVHEAAVAVADAGADANADADAADDIDPMTSDAGPPPVQCVDAACAKSLVLTYGVTAAASLPPPFPQRQLPSGSYGFCALLDDATVACWGAGGTGQLGRGSSIKTSAVPERVAGLKDIVRLSHTCAVDKDGAAWCWGTGPFLQSSTVAYSTQQSPVNVAIPTATHVDFLYSGDPRTNLGINPYLHSVGCAVLEGNQVACWGMNRNGQVHPPTLTESGTEANPVTTIDIPDGAPLQDIFVGTASFLLRTDGTLLSWGANPPLGRITSLFPDPRPKPVALTGITYVDVEAGNVCVVAHGAVHCWGTTYQGRAARIAPALENAMPRRIELPEPAVSVATSAGPYGYDDDANPQRGCAVTLSGDVYCWGSNTSGQAGDGTREPPVRPVKVKGLPAPASIVRTAALATCALLTTGKVYCWGENGFGELGNGDIKEPSLAPVEVLLQPFAKITRPRPVAREAHPPWIARVLITAVSFSGSAQAN
ncbi:MAG: hypothetical protein K0S65_5860 [Labilithrix sp.]|nr:hypothetical protein [Labilithrix sp.]